MASIQNVPATRVCPKMCRESVYKESTKMPESSLTVEGFDFNNGLNYEELLGCFKRTGFQALHLGQAVDEINRMLQCRDLPMEEIAETEGIDDYCRPKTNCTIFLGYTSNMVSSGLREVIRFLVEHKMVDVLVTTTGGIEEDIIKCITPTYLGDFRLKGADLRSNGWNRTGNLIVPNTGYIQFEQWLPPLLDEMLIEQNEEGINWTPSKLIRKMGEKIDHPKSIYYWAYKNDIPVFCPAITDGAIGDNIYFQRYKNPGLRIDIAEDIERMNNQAVFAQNSGQIILGGGLAKHHINNANCFRNGANYSVFLNTAGEFDGSDAGAAPDEAVSWGKIKVDAKPVKVVADATLTFPIIVAETFAKYHYKKKCTTS